MFQKLKVRINGLSVFVVKSPGLDIEIITHFISRQGKKKRGCAVLLLLRLK